MRDHNKLRAFELADEIVLMTYRITAEFPKAEMFGLTSQMRRAAIWFLQILSKDAHVKVKVNI